MLNLQQQIDLHREIINRHANRFMYMYERGELLPELKYIYTSVEYDLNEDDQDCLYTYIHSNKNYKLEQEYDYIDQRETFKYLRDSRSDYDSIRETGYTVNNNVKIYLLNLAQYCGGRRFLVKVDRKLISEAYCSYIKSAINEMKKEDPELFDHLLEHEFDHFNDSFFPIDENNEKVIEIHLEYAAKRKVEHRYTVFNLNRIYRNLLLLHSYTEFNEEKYLNNIDTEFESFDPDIIKKMLIKYNIKYYNSKKTNGITELFNECFRFHTETIDDVEVKTLNLFKFTDVNFVNKHLKNL